MNAGDSLFVKPYNCLILQENANKTDYEHYISYGTKRAFLKLNKMLYQGYTFYETTILQSDSLDVNNLIYEKFVDFNRKR